jgi:Transposase, Mutator family
VRAARPVRAGGLGKRASGNAGTAPQADPTERGDPEASLFPNSRNGTTAKMVSSEIGDVELAVPRERNGTFTPQLVPKGARRLGGPDEMSRTITSGDQS